MESGVSTQGSGVRSWSSELELESGVRGQYAGVRSQESVRRGQESGVGGGAKVRASGYGVFAEGSSNFPGRGASPHATAHSVPTVCNGRLGEASLPTPPGRGASPHATAHSVPTVRNGRLGKASLPTPSATVDDIHIITVAQS